MQPRLRIWALVEHHPTDGLIDNGSIYTTLSTLLPNVFLYSLTYNDALLKVCLHHHLLHLSDGLLSLSSGLVS